MFLQSSDTKFYLTLGSALWGIFKGFTWVKDIRDKDLKGIKDDLSNQTGVISSGFSRLADSIHEMRTDLRTFYTSPDPLMMPVSARATRKRKSVESRSAAKGKKAPVKKKPA